ncbi:MAG: hypothetical protein KDA61_07685 [Planctomycetales bacterium]|nr:hypothetical protein [Planctomycetales bacterium]
MRPLFFSLALLLVFTTKPALSTAESVKVFLLAGHSNIGGTAFADDLDPAWNVPQDDVWIWLDHNVDGIGDWAPLEPGHGNVTHSARPDDPEGITPPDDGRPRVGPELSLGRTLADAYPDSRIAIIKQVRSGTIAEWSPANVGPPDTLDHPWSSLLQKTGDALAALENAGHSFEIAGLFWAVGGRDARNWNSNSADPDEVVVGRDEALARSATYGVGLTEFIDGVREEFGSNLPIVMTRIGDDIGEPVLLQYPGAELVRAAQIEVTSIDPLTTTITGDGITLGDLVHYDAMGQIEFGRRFASAYINRIATPEPSGAMLAVLAIAPFVARKRTAT